MQPQVNIRVGMGLTGRTAPIFVEGLQSLRDNVDLTIQLFEVVGFGPSDGSFHREFFRLASTPMRSLKLMIFSLFVNPRKN